MTMLSILDHFVQGCDKNTATLELLGMLFIFALLGFLLRHVLGNASAKLKANEEEILSLKLEISQLQEKLNDQEINTAVIEKKWKEAQYDKEELIRHAKETGAAEERAAKQREQEAKDKEAQLNAAKILEENERIEKERERLEAAFIHPTPEEEITKEEEVAEAAAEEEITQEEIAIAKEEEESAEARERRLIEEQREREHLERLERLRQIKEAQAREEQEKNDNSGQSQEVISEHKEEKSEDVIKESETPTEEVAVKKPIVNRATKKDDLKVIEGIGPAIERWMNENGILSYEEMANYTGDELNDILAKAGPRFRVHDAGTWGEQAKLLAAGKIDEFNKFTAKLIAGKKVKK